jgi:hypothetical protein
MTVGFILAAHDSLPVKSQRTHLLIFKHHLSIFVLAFSLRGQYVCQTL